MACTPGWSMDYVVYISAPRVLAGDLRDGQRGWRYREHDTEMRQPLVPEVHAPFCLAVPLSSLLAHPRFGQ